MLIAQEAAPVRTRTVERTEFLPERQVFVERAPAYQERLKESCRERTSSGCSSEEEKELVRQLERLLTEAERAEEASRAERSGEPRVTNERMSDTKTDTEKDLTQEIERKRIRNQKARETLERLRELHGSDAVQE
ncbi:MAG: hypothetical protein H0T47_12170 [Planctomycetaceae bacterium]|nr:hypothetical protein [Planctomycetaceae bacterium]